MTLNTVPAQNYSQFATEGQQINTHFRFVGNASRYIHTHCAITFIVYSIHVFSSHDDKVSNRERKRKREGHHKTAASQR